VSIDLTNYRPILLEEIIDAMNAAPKPGEYELMTTPKEHNNQLFRMHDTKYTKDGIPAS
jgi:hypothetical protein